MDVMDAGHVRALRSEAIRLAEAFGREAASPGGCKAELEAAVEMQAAANHLGRVERCLAEIGSHRALQPA
jgi:hypothetical protein